MRWPSPAMIVACIALAVALSGASYAAIVLPKNSVGTKQIRANAVKSPKIAPNAVRGVDVDEATLGQVPSALNATNAANATHAATAVNAQNAENAANAQNAANAANSQNAETAENAADADLLDGIDSNGFASATSEPWHNIGAAGEPAFACHSPYGCFENFGEPHNPAGFYKDPLGIVHLKGLIKWTSGSGTPLGGCGWWAFVLPAGYRPAVRELHPSLESRAASAIEIDNSGAVYPCSANSIEPNEWFALDGITFRAAG